MAQSDAPTEFHDLEKANVVGDESASHEHIAHEESSSSASVDGEKQAQSSPESVDTSEASQSYLVKWDGPDDPTNPHNWPTLFRWAVTILKSCGGFITMMSGSMIAPALPALSHDLHMSQAKLYGRRPVWLICGVFYSVWSIVSGFSPNKVTLVASRLLSGFGGSVDFVIAYPVRSDIWKPEERGKSFAIASFLPLLGPAIGPLVGGAISQMIGWRWIFWVVAIFIGCLMFVGIFFFPETSAARILGNKARKLSKDTGGHYHTEYEGPNMKLSDKLWTSITRPTRLLATQPILQLVSVFMAYNFGVLYFVLSTFASLFTDEYHQTVSQIGYHYLALAVGYCFANQKRTGGSTAPEYRVPLMVPGGLLIPIGLFWYGWSAQAKLHWIMPDIGAAIFGCGFILNTQAMGAYILDSFGKYTASATAASQVLRMTAGFVFPIFASAMYHRLGWGWGNSTLGFIALVFGLPAPLILWMFDAKIRAMGKQQW
ncbi:hypothetical protein JMJ35_002368 [Cladonia borealis]|uniref:Major facilitator superfamily (MFS) profile domain-containing protein n=1 Tax=Cladonia borealis TaxID=184061 RepID=A0AA39R782_9LECA|nr:hypothetical protein JMJ35_002368 [Cladonia borealis]